MIANLVSVLVGFIVGVLSGMLGIGGGMIMLPVFRLGYLMAPLQATATSLFTIVPTSIAGSITHLRNKTCVPIVGVAAGIGGACTSPLGVYLASVSPTWLVMLAAAVVIGYSAVTMFKKARALPKASTSASDADEPAGPLASKAEADASSATPTAEAGGSMKDGGGQKRGFGTVARAVAIGLIAGVASGYIGVGGGFIMIPLFTVLLGLEMKKASGTSLIAVSILAVPGVIEQISLGNVLVMAGLAMAVGSIPGAIVGAAVSKRVPERGLRYLFSIMLLVSAAMLVVKELGL